MRGLQIKKAFTPEFPNRLETIRFVRSFVWRGFTQVVYKLIVELRRPADRGAPKFSQEARDWLAEKGYDRAMGAPPDGRVIQDNRSAAIERSLRTLLRGHSPPSRWTKKMR